MKKKVASVSAVLLFACTILFTSGLYFDVPAKLKDFKDDVEQEEDSSSSGGGDGGSCVGDAVGSCMGQIFEEIGKALTAVWRFHNSTVYYTSYPYSENREKHIKHIKKADIKEETIKTIDDEGSESIETVEPPVDMFANKFYYYTVTTGGQWAQGDGSGFLIEVRGKFWQFLGPLFIARALWDGTDNLQYYSGCLNLSIFQARNMSLDLYGGGSFMRGILDRSGGAYGAIITSFPGKPMSVYLRMGGISYEKINFFDCELRIGVHINRVKLFAGYQFITSEQSFLGGPVGGITVFL